MSAVARNPIRVQPLHSAAAGGHTAVARLLLEHGADPNARQEGGFVPLHAAAQAGNDELYELLVASGAGSGRRDRRRPDRGRLPRRLVARSQLAENLHHRRDRRRLQRARERDREDVALRA